MIHLNPKAVEGPTFDLILAYLHSDNDIAGVVWKYYVPHAFQWLSPTNVALSVYAEVHHLTAYKLLLHQNLFGTLLILPLF